MNPSYACKEARADVERQVGSAALEAHLARCPRCRDYAGLRRWTAAVVRSGELQAAPPPMAAVWAAIRRNSESAWESALARSFRRLVPYLAGITGILVIAGSLAFKPAPPVVETTPSEQALLAPNGALATNEIPEQAPGDLLGIGPR